MFAIRQKQTGMLNISTSPRYTSLSLKDIVCLCAGPHDDAAWEEFVLRVGRPISLTILRTTSLWGERSVPLVEDLVQVTYLKLWEDNCRLLRDFAIHHPEAILGYVKKTAANVTHDYFKHRRSQSSGGMQPHISTSDVDPEAGKEVDGNHGRITIQILLKQIDDHLQRTLLGSDRERDRTIFWLYFRQGMSTREIASIPTIALSAKGVGSVIERLKQCVRAHILGMGQKSEESQHDIKSKLSGDLVFSLWGASKHGAAAR
jgi:RNA polymerase sigma-70 factor, ECF subfamily